MWPRLLAQLFELLPHLTRLIPQLDRFLSGRSQGDERLTAVAEEVHRDLGQVTRAHAALYRHLQELSAQVDTLGGEVRATHAAVQHHEQRLDALDTRLRGLTRWLQAAVVLLLAVLALLAWSLWHGSH
ncbi:MAG: hypothetical protein KGK08_08240 [Acidobacteriota bacterium]|nr:hypothetical protein [Acidobacteriota bacterium]